VEYLTLFNDGGMINGADFFFSPAPTGQSNNGNTSASFSNTNEYVAPTTCTVSNLFLGAHVIGSFGSVTQVATVTLYHGAGAAAPTATSLTCTTGGFADTVGAQGSCSDTTHTVSISAGDVLTLRLHDSSETNSAPSTSYSVRMQCQ